MKTKLTSLLLIFFLYSCSDSENDHINESQGINSEEVIQLDIERGLGVAFENLRIDFNTPVTYTYSTIGERDLIIESIIGDVFAVDLRSDVNEYGQTISDEFNVNIVISELTKTIVLYPEPINSVIVTGQTSGDNEACGGKAGDGWKSYETCQTPSCVETKSKEAAADLSKSLSSGKCLDIRIKRNTLNARVCGRVIDC